jgi:hypothetical protein
MEIILGDALFQEVYLFGKQHVLLGSRALAINVCNITL